MDHWRDRRGGAGGSGGDAGHARGRVHIHGLGRTAGGGVDPVADQPVGLSGGAVVVDGNRGIRGVDENVVALAFGAGVAVDGDAVRAADAGVRGGVAADRVVALVGFGDLGAVAGEGLAACGKASAGAGDRGDTRELLRLAAGDVVGLGGVRGPLSGAAGNRDGRDLVINLECGRGGAAGRAATDNVAGVLRLRRDGVDAARQTGQAEGAAARRRARRTPSGSRAAGRRVTPGALVVAGGEGAHRVAAGRPRCHWGR